MKIMKHSIRITAALLLILSLLPLTGCSLDLNAILNPDTVIDLPWPRDEQIAALPTYTAGRIISAEVIEDEGVGGRMHRIKIVRTDLRDFKQYIASVKEAGFSFDGAGDEQLTVDDLTGMAVWSGSNGNLAVTVTYFDSSSTLGKSYGCDLMLTLSPLVYAP